jgi:hypothetical protein
MLCEDDFLGGLQPLKAVPMLSAALPPSCKENVYFSAPRSGLVRRICFSSHSATADAARDQMEKVRTRSSYMALRP